MTKEEELSAVIETKERWELRGCLRVRQPLRIKKNFPKNIGYYDETFKPLKNSSLLSIG